MSNKDRTLFDKALAEAFDAVVKGRIEDVVTESVTKLTKRIEQEVNANRSKADSVESVVFPKLPTDVHELEEQNDLCDDFYPIG